MTKKIMQMMIMTMMFDFDDDDENDDNEIDICVNGKNRWNRIIINLGEKKDEIIFKTTDVQRLSRLPEIFLLNVKISFAQLLSLICNGWMKQSHGFSHRRRENAVHMFVKIMPSINSISSKTKLRFSLFLWRIIISSKLCQHLARSLVTKCN